MPFTAEIFHLLHPSVKSVHTITTGSRVKKRWKSFVLLYLPILKYFSCLFIIQGLIKPI